MSQPAPAEDRGPVDELAFHLRDLRIRAGSPSISQLVTLTSEQPGDRKMPRSTIQDKLHGVTAPSLEQVLALVKAFADHAISIKSPLPDAEVREDKWREAWYAMQRARLVPRGQRYGAARAARALSEADQSDHPRQASSLRHHHHARSKSTRALSYPTLGLLIDIVEEIYTEPDIQVLLMRSDLLSHRHRNIEREVMQQDEFSRYELLLRESVMGAKDRAVKGDIDAQQSLLAFAELALDGQDPEGDRRDRIRELREAIHADGYELNWSRDADGRSVARLAGLLEA